MHESELNARLGVERTTKRKSRKPLDRLTRDAIAAEKAGMSYGKYKALHPHTPDVDEYEDEEIILQDSVCQTPNTTPAKIRTGQRTGTCAQCGQPFACSPRKSNMQYCSVECRIKHNNIIRTEKRKRNNPGELATCPICGTKFVTDNQHRIYCRMECYRESQQRRAKERRERQKEEQKKEAEKNGSN